MFFSCIKQYFSNLRYVFTALGLMFLALLIGVSVFFNGFKNSINTMIDNIKETTNDADLSTDRVWKAIENDFTSIFNDEESYQVFDNDTDGFISAEESEEFMKESLDSALSKTVDNYIQYAEEIGEIIINCLANIFMFSLIFVAIQILAIALSNIFIQFLCRSDIEHRNPFHLIISNIFHSIMIIACLALIAYASYKWPDIAIVLIILYPIFYCLLSLLGANISMGKKRLSFKQAMKISNILILFISNIVIVILSILIGFIVLYFSNILIALYITLSLLIVCSVTVSLNADLILYKSQAKLLENNE